MSSERKKIHDRIVCVIPKILRFALFDKYEFENYLCDKREKVARSEQLHFD